MCFCGVITIVLELPCKGKANHYEKYIVIGSMNIDERSFIYLFLWNFGARSIEEI